MSPSRNRGSAAIRSKTCAFVTPKVQIDALAFHQSLAEQLLQQVEAHLGVVEDRGIDALRASPQLLLLLAHRLGELGLGDLAAVEFRDSAAPPLRRK